VAGQNEDADIHLNREWVQQAFSKTPAPATDDRLIVVHEDSPGDTKLGRCAFGGPLRLGDKVYTRGIGVNSRSVLRISLTRPAKRFLADIGLDRNVDGTAASVTMHVRVGDKDLFATPVIRPNGKVHSIDVPLDGATTFDLIVNNGGDGRGWDQADWADARIILADGSESWIDDLARQWQLGAGLPFSFVYAGQHSAVFLNDWQQQIEDESIDNTKRRRTLTLTDPKTKLEVRAVCTIYNDTPGADWTLYFTNNGNADTPVLEQVKALDTTVTLPVGHEPILHQLRSTSAVDDWLPYQTPLPTGERIEFAPIRGRSSCGACPFFNLQWNGGGVITAIGWTGQWVASIEHTADRLCLQAGMQNMHLKLRPGETVRTPRILQLYWTGQNLDRSYNLFRQTMFRHVMPKIDGQNVTPPIAHLSTAFYETDNGTEAIVLSHLEAAKDLGFEFFWLDAYYGKYRFPTVGHYVRPFLRGLDTKRFPRGIRPVSDAAHQNNMKFLWWVEPERICPSTLMAIEHPEWVVIPEEGPWGMFNLAIPEARRYITDYMIDAVKEFRVDCLRIDNAVDYRTCWALLDKKTPDRVGINEIRYVEGLYRMWDDIRAAHPHLFIDNCSSGGHRIDLETCSRSIPLWRTDATIGPLLGRDFNQAALQNQIMTAGLSRFVPFSTSGQMGATPYLFRSGFNAGIAFCEDVRPAEYPRDLLKQAIAEAKRIRKYYFGNFYPLSDVTTTTSETSTRSRMSPPVTANGASSSTIGRPKTTV
jgi:alpha-galactosidase